MNKMVNVAAALFCFAIFVGAWMHDKVKPCPLSTLLATLECGDPEVTAGFENMGWRRR